MMEATIENAGRKSWPSLAGKATNRYFFLFEEDFAGDNIRCIPMIVRFRLDAVGIKLKLNEWSRFSAAERNLLVRKECITESDILWYREYLQRLVLKAHGKLPSELPVDLFPAWENSEEIPAELVEMMDKLDGEISVSQWRSLNDLQRFALLKLCRPGHENRNFPAAVREFALV